MGIYGGVFCGLDGRKRKEERMFWKNIKIASLGIYLPFLDFSFSSAFFQKTKLKTEKAKTNKTKNMKKHLIELGSGRLSKQCPQSLESRLRVLGKDNILPSTKHSIAQQHLQFHGKCLSNLEEPGCLVVVFVGCGGR